MLFIYLRVTYIHQYLSLPCRLHRSLPPDAAHTDAAARDNAAARLAARRRDDAAERWALEAVPSDWHGNDHHKERQVRQTYRRGIYRNPMRLSCRALRNFSSVIKIAWAADVIVCISTDVKNNTQKNKRETTTTRKHLKRRQRRRTVKWSAATPSVLSPRSLNLNFSMLVLILSDGVAVKRSLDAGACKLFTATSRQQFSQANKASEGCAGCEVRAA